MSFTTKKYTRPYLLKTVRSLKPSNFNSLSTFTSAISPRAGRSSAQVSALRSILREHNLTLNLVFLNGEGSYNKQTLVKLLKN